MQCGLSFGPETNRSLHARASEALPIRCLSACHGMATKANSNVTKIRSIYILPLGLVRPAPKNIDLSEFVEPVSTMGPNGGRTATSVQFQKQPVEIACYFDFTEPTRSGSAG